MISIVLGLLICLGGAAWADKPRIAVLGLEAVAGAGGAVDPGAQIVAREITRELRQRVQSPASPYVIAPNSNKELLDEKILMSCDNEAPECMVVIGAGLACDVLLYGRVEKKGDSFRVSLKLLDVKRRTVQPATDDLPVGGAAAGVSRRLHNKLIGEEQDTDGTLIVKARSDSGRAVRGGTVKVDEAARGPLTGGKLTVPDLAEGRHTVTIEVPGFRRFEEIVTIRGGEQSALDALLRANLAEAPETRDPPDKPPRSRPSPLWKWSAAAGAAVVLGGVGYAYYAYDRENNHNTVHYLKPSMGMNYTVPDQSQCGKSIEQVNKDTNTTVLNPDTFNRACTWHTRNVYGLLVAGVGGALAITSLIMLSRDPGPAEGPASGARGKKSDVAIVPILTPEVAGAQLSLAW
ncbi:MAG TPA: PEGA domain-containing protein [Kofleriaceae bacterium]